MTKDAFNRKGSGDKNKEKNKPSNTEPENNPEGFKERVTSVGRAGAKVGKKSIKNKLSKSDGLTGSAYRGYEKIKKVTKKTKKYTGWLIKYATFCISNPIGWIIGFITIYMCWSAASSIADSIKQTNEGTNNGTKTTIILLDCPKPSGSNSSDGKTNSKDASAADWTKEGTKAYENAKYVFDTWVEAGLSGEAASGIVGWVASEGNFDIVGRAEGHTGGGAKDSIANGAVPIPVASGYAVGGGGIYQFTPYTKYAQLNDPIWEDPRAITKFAISDVASGNWKPNPNDLTGGNHTVEQFAQETNPEQATLMWNSYERGNPAYIPKDRKQADAKRANEIFNKDGHKFNRDKFDKNFGSAKKTDGTTSSNDSNVNVKCKPNSSGGGNGWQGKGGKHNYSNGQAWKPDDLPGDLKQYAIDPKSMGMKYQDREGWDPIHPYGFMANQCTGLSTSLMYNLWEKDGKHPTQLMGNGNQVVNNWVNTFGGSSTKEPVSGAVFSSDGSRSAGHTGVVSHVFDDGSILIIEQNFEGLSGEGAGMSYSWDYRIVSKDSLGKNNYEFYNPGDNGFKVNSSAKSM